MVGSFLLGTMIIELAKLEVEIDIIPSLSNSVNSSFDKARFQSDRV